MDATCPNGHQNRVGAKFCRVCGIEFRVVCNNGHSNNPDAQYCETCGSDIFGVSPDATAGELTPLVLAPDIAAPATRQEPTFTVPQVSNAELQLDLRASNNEPTSVTTTSSSPNAVAPDRWTGSDLHENATGSTGSKPLDPRDGDVDDGVKASRRKLIISLGIGILVIIAVAVVLGFALHHSAKPTTSSSATSTSGTPRVLPSWSTPTVVDGLGAALYSISCPSASFCATVDNEGNAYTYDGTSWSAGQSIGINGQIGRAHV